jgi:hypothetical protein
MALISRDTRPPIVDLLLEGYRAMTPAQKLARVADLSAAARGMAEARIRRQYPGANATEIRLRVAALTLGRGTMMRVFSWDPVKERW